MADMEKSINELSDDELKALLDRMSTGKEEPEVKKTAPEKLKVTLSDGSVIEGDNQEDLNRQLSARLEEARNQSAPPPPAAPQPGKPEWNYEEFTKKFLKDPREGLDYLDVAENGYSTRKAVPALLQIVSALAKKTQELETQRFLDQNDEYTPNQQNRAALEKIITERGWQPGYQSYQDAFDIAKSRGIIHAKKSEEPEPEPQSRSFVPPRVRSKAQETTSEDFFRATDKLSDEKLEDLLIDAGMIKSRRFGR